MGGYDLFIKLKDKLKIIEPFDSNEYELDVIWENCIRDILSYFIRDVSENSLKNINDDNHESISHILYQNDFQKYS